MSTYQDIHSALVQSLVDLNSSTLGDLRIAHEGQFFDPRKSNETVFIDESFIFDDQISLSKNTLDEVSGIYQLTVYQRSNLGLSNIISIVDAIISNYKHGDTITNGSSTVYIINSGRAGGSTVNGWYSIPVRVFFKVDILRV